VAELEKRQFVLEDSMDGLKSKPSQTESHLCEIEERILKFELLLEKRVCDGETFSKRQSLLEDSMGSLKSKASQIDVHLCEIQARILKLEPLLDDQRKLATAMERMQREISDIASADDFQLNFAPKMNEKLHHCQNQVKVLEGHVSSLKDTLQNNSASETSQNTCKLDSPSLVATSASAAVSEFVDGKTRTDATSAQGLSGHLAGSKELLARRPRSASMPKPSTRQVFVPFKVPPHPEDDTSRRCTLQVEEELQTAKRSNAPPEVRKRLLKEVLLRLHSDKIGGSSEPMNWFETWRSKHLKWYYSPHPVPEADKRYLSEET